MPNFAPMTSFSQKLRMLPILGSGDFVNEALSKAGEEWELQAGPRPPLEALINTVSKAFNLSSKQLKSKSRKRPLVDARSVLARIAV